jgi:zinc protease
MDRLGVLERAGVHRFGAGMEIERYRLANGLTVLLLVDPSAPVISYQTWFAVGSRHERPGTTGIAHLFEHLMFNETESYPLGEFDRRLEEAGAESNAATYLDWTYYLINAPKEALPLAIELEAERMHRLVVRKPQVESEREVVANERRQTVDDDVDGAVSELLYETAFLAHSYRHPTIGTMADILGFTTKDCRTFYTRYYAPNNAVLVVVGDVDRQLLADGLAAHYAPIRPAKLPQETTPVEPPQERERWVTTDKPTETARLLVGYKSPPMSDHDHLVLTILSEILFGGRGSRGYRLLCSDLELCSDASAAVGNFRDPSLWEMHLSARPGVTPRAVCDGLDRLLASVVEDPVTRDELDRACARLELATLQGLESASGKGEHIGFSEVVLGDPTAAYARLEDYRGCSVNDVSRVAHGYLRREARTVVEVRPA